MPEPINFFSTDEEEDEREPLSFFGEEAPQRVESIDFLQYDEQSYLEKMLREQDLFTSQAPDPVGAASAALHGASFGYMGEAPNTTGGTVAELGGMLLSTIALTRGAGMALRGAGLAAPEGMVGKMAFEGAQSLPADYLFLKSPLAEDMENPELMLPILTGVNMLTVPLGRVLSLSKEKMTIPKIEGGKPLYEVLDDVSKETLDTEGVSFAEMLSKEPRAQTALRGTSLEKDIVRYNQLGDEFRAIEETDSFRWSEENRKVRWGDDLGGTNIGEGVRASREAVDDFLTQRIGRQLTQDEQVQIMNRLGARSSSKIINVDSFNERAFEMWKRGEVDLDATTSWNPKFFQEELDLLVRKLDDIESAVDVGLPPTATYKEIAKKSEDINKHLTKLSKEIVENPERKRILDEASKVADTIFKNRELGVTPEFAGAAADVNELVKLRTSNALFSKTDSLAQKTDEMSRLIDNLQRNQEKVEKLLHETNTKATKRDFNTPRQTEEIMSIITGKGEIDPKKYARMRVPVGHYMTTKFDELVSPTLINKELGEQLQKVREEMAALGDPKNQTLLKRDPTDIKTRTSELREQEIQIKRQLTESLTSNPTQARALALQTGDETLATAVDFYFASLGDVVSQNYLLGRRMLGNRRFASDLYLNRLVNDARPTLDSTVDELGKPTGKKTLVSEHPHDLDPGLTDDLSKGTQQEIIGKGKDLSTFRRLFSTPEVVARVYKAASESETMKTIYGRFEQYFLKAGQRYNQILEDHEWFDTNLFKPFQKYITDLGEDGSKVVGLVDEVSKLANTLIKEGVDGDEVERIISKKVAGASEPIREGYRKYREIDDWIREKTNESIRRVNRMIDTGELKGVEKLEQIPYRPGHIHFKYEGDYILWKVDADGRENFVDYVMGRDQAVKTIEHEFKTYPDTKGRYVLVPKLIDDAGDLVKLGVLGRDMNRTFGVDASHLKRLVDNKEFTRDTVHDVFYGARKERVLGLEESRIDTLRATALSAMSSIRYSNYIDMTLEGRQLAKMAGDMSLPKWQNYIRTYSNDLLGISRDLEKSIDNHLQGFVEMITERVPQTRDFLAFMGYTPNSRAVKATSNMLTFLGRTTALGFNIGTAFINMMIVPTNVLAATSMENVLYAMRNTYKAWKNPEMKALFRKGGIGLRQSGVLFKDEMHRPDILKSWAAKGYEKVDNLSMWAFNKTEDMARSTTIVASRRHAEQMAKSLSKGIEPNTWQEKLLRDIARGRGQQVTSKEVLDEYALHIMRSTNFDYSMTGLSELARNPVAKPFMQFKTFIQKEIEFLMGESVPLTKKEKFLALGMFGAIGGAFALPGVDDIDAASRWVFGVSPKLWMDTYLPEVLTAGVPALAGIDLSSRMSLGSIDHLTDTSTFPFGLGIARAGKAIRGLHEGTMDTSDALLYTMSSLNAARQGFTLLSTGKLTDQYGQKIAESDDMGSLALMARVIGFPSTLEGKVQRFKTAAYSSNQYATRKQRQAMREILDAQERGDNRRVEYLKEKSGISNRQIKAARKKREESVRQLMTEKVRLDDRDRYRDTLEQFPE